MKRRSFLSAIAALPAFRLFKKTEPSPRWKGGPIDVIFVGEHPNGRWIKDPFIKVNLDNGPVTVDGITFSSSIMMNVKLSQWNETTVEPTESSIAKLRNILVTNVGGGTMDLVWGPELDIFQSWVRIQKEGANHSLLIPIDKDEHSKSDFVTAIAKNTPKKFTKNGIYDLMTSDAKFYHIVEGNESNLWATGVEVGTTLKKLTKEYEET